MQTKEENTLEVQGAILQAERWVAAGRFERGLAVLNRAIQKLPESPAAWMDLLVPAVKAASLYGHSNLMRRWIRHVERRWARIPSQDRADCEAAGEELSLLRLWVDFKTAAPSATAQLLEEAFSRIRHWKPWLVQFRWVFLFNLGRYEDLEDSISSPPPCPIRRGTAAYGGRLLLLGMRFLWEMRFRPAEIVLRSAVRKLAEVPESSCLHMHAAALCYLAQLYHQTGRYAPGLEALQRAETITKRIRFRGLRSDLSQMGGLLLILKGDHAAASKAFIQDRDPGTRAGFARRIRAAHGYLNAALCEIQMGCLARAQTYVRHAAKLLHALPLSVTHGILLVTRGDLKVATGSPLSLRAAARLYDKAEEVYRATPSPRFYSDLLHIRRGTLYLKQQNFPAAIECAEMGNRAAEASGCEPIRCESILLKSYLLLERTMPHSHLYEEVLKGLGSLHDPVTLFKAVSNLYIYSWDMGDFLDLTDLHLKQIEKVRERLEPKLFARLYRTYITERVFERMHKRLGTAEGAKARRVSAM